ncbi:MAG: GDSL-type esterase/lipase family protein [Acutalibacteraceae bacterium]|nr:GDSL-type esterase/lipase family protein [Acutalibacteraceae bacterium]
MKLNLNKRDKICFFGDSITANGLWIKEVIEYFVEKHPDLKVGFYNCGIGGTKGYEANIKDRMFADLFGFSPKYVVVMFGMNDVPIRLCSPLNTEQNKTVQIDNALNKYPASLENIIEMCKKYDAIPIICSPTPYDQYNERERENWQGDVLLQKCSNAAKEVADKHGLLYIDMRTAMIDNMDKKPIGEDRVHPNAFGQHIMAQSFLKGIGEIDEIDADSVCKFSKINEERFAVEQKLRQIMFVERNYMGWHYEEDMPLDERKKHVEEKDWDQGLLGIKQTYLENVDYSASIYADLIRLTLNLYES